LRLSTPGSLFSRQKARRWNKWTASERQPQIPALTSKHFGLISVHSASLLRDAKLPV